jgi:acetyltransferase
MAKDEKLECLLNPRSIAVIGASDKPEKMGYMVLENILQGYKGEIYPINPKINEVLGLKCYPNVSDVPGDIDIGVISVPAKAVLDVVKDCARKKVNILLVITSGFSEIGNKALEDEIVQVCKSSGMRLIGPNIFGMANTVINCNTTFGRALPYKGKVAFITQSGALGLALNGWTYLEKVGLSYMISIGNIADVCSGDIAEVLEDDPNTNCICQYIEGVHDGRRFFNICKKASKKKPIVALKAGKSVRGVKAAASHTGSLAGATKVYEAAFKQSGVIEAENLKDMFNFSATLSLQPPMLGDRVAIISNGGGAGVCATDAAERYGIPIQDISEELQKEFRKCMPEYGSAKNPVDLTGMAQREQYEYAIRKAIESDEIDGITVVLCHTTFVDPIDVAKGVVECSKSSKKPIVASSIGGKECEEAMIYLKERGVPAYPDPADAIKGLGALREYGRYLERPEEEFKPWSVDKESVRKIIEQNRGKIVLENRAKEIFSAYGISIPKERVVKSSREALTAAKEIGFPIVMKIVSKDILHKSDAHCVKVNVKENEVENVYNEVIENAKRYDETAEIEGVLVQRMAPPGRETIVGTILDPQFGPCIMFGLGGVFVEVLKDVVFRIAPISREEGLEMMKEIKGYPILQGVRGEMPADMDSLAEAISRLSQLVYDFPEIKEIDANPIFTYEKGYIAADARIILK